MLNFAQAPDAQGQVVSFGEGEEAKPMHQALREFLASLPPMVSFGEQATKDRAHKQDADTVEYAENANPASVEMDKKVRAYMAQHKVDYPTAFKAVTT